MPIKEKPLLEHWLTTVKRAGATNVLVNLHYLAEIVQEFLSRSIFKDWVYCIYEPSLTGTAGALRANYENLRNSTILLVHADNYCDCNFDDFINFHYTKRPQYCPITMMGRTALHQAALTGHRAIATTLVDAKAAVDVLDKNGTTALMLAAQQGNNTCYQNHIDHYSGNWDAAVARVDDPPSIVDTLITAGANLNARDTDGVTALVFAAEAGSAPTVTKLVVAGAALDLTTNEETTALIAAAELGSTACARALVNAKAKLDMHNNIGVTALMAAANSDSPDIVQLLLSAGANASLRSDCNKTALQYVGSTAENGALTTTLLRNAIRRKQAQEGGPSQC